MKVSRIILFVIVCCVSFIALLGVYAFALFDIIMPKGETYNDPNNGLAIELPGGWVKYNTADDGTVVFSKGKHTLVFYEWGDYWQIIKPGGTRSSEESLDSYDRYINGLYTYSPTLKTIGGREYYTLRIDNGKGVLLLAFHYHDGIEFKFSMVPENSSDEYAFFRFLRSVRYPEGWSNHSLLGSFETAGSGSGSGDDFKDFLSQALKSRTLSESADKVTQNIALLNLLFVFIVFLIPLIACRLIFFKRLPGRKQASLTALAVAFITAAALAFSLYYTGVSLWFTFEAAALGLITYILIKPRERFQDIYETSSGGQAADETDETAQSPATPETKNDTTERDLPQGPGVVSREEPKERTETSASYCWHCGKALPRDARFCPICGTDLREP
jgi:hypothetical protein